MLWWGEGKRERREFVVWSGRMENSKKKDTGRVLRKKPKSGVSIDHVGSFLLGYI